MSIGSDGDQVVVREDGTVWEPETEQVVIDFEIPEAAEDEVEALIDNMVLLLNYWLTYDHLQHDERPPALIIHKGVYQLMSMVAPYLGEHQREFYQQVSEIYRQIVVPSAAGDSLPG